MYSEYITAAGVAVVVFIFVLWFLSHEERNAVNMDLQHIIPIPESIAKNAERYQQLELRLREIVTGLVWYKEEDKPPVPVAVLKIGMTDENTVKYQESLAKRGQGLLKCIWTPPPSKETVFALDHALYREYACIKMTCFETETGLNFNKMLKEKQLDVIWNTDHRNVWTLKLCFKGENEPIHFLGGEN